MDLVQKVILSDVSVKYIYSKLRGKDYILAKSSEYGSLPHDYAYEIGMFCGQSIDINNVRHNLETILHDPSEWNDGNGGVIYSHHHLGSILGICALFGVINDIWKNGFKIGYDLKNGKTAKINLIERKYMTKKSQRWYVLIQKKREPLSIKELKYANNHF